LSCISIKPHLEALKIEDLIGILRIDDGNGNENVKKAIGFDWQNNNFARATHFFCTFLYRHCTTNYIVKMPNFTFYEGRKQATTKFSFSFALGYGF